nr:MAG TPA: PhnA Zinc-Ribbon [Caudoviricetes sp.]
MSGAGLLSIEWEIADQHLPMPHIVATACAAFVEEAERRGLVIRSGPSPSVLHALRLVKVTGKVSKPDDAVEEPCTPHTLRRCPACGVHIYDLTDVEGDAK